jgi:hypothetical protein
VVEVGANNKHAICGGSRRGEYNTHCKSESQTTVPHKYIRDTLTFKYKECKFCGTRTQLTCIKCGYCYSCHWKKEEVGKQLLDTRYYGSNSPPLIPSRKNELTDKIKQKEEDEEQPQEQKRQQQQQQLIMNVFGQVSKPICTYYRCHHKFSLHGSSRCRCRHPTNKTLGIFMRYP